MDRTRRWAGSFLLLGILAAPAAQVAGEAEIELKKTLFFGGGGDQRGTGLSSYGGADLYLSGADETARQAIAVHYLLSSTGAPLLDWAVRWPNVPGPHADSEVFTDVVATRAGIFFVGRSYTQTQDGVGDKEAKSILVKFSSAGPTGPGIGGAEWVATPNFFAYRGNESFEAVAFGPGDALGASHALYAAGRAQANGVNNTAILAKYDLAGKLLWARVLGNTGWFMNSFGTGVTVAGNGDVYVAGTTEYPYTVSDSTQLALWKFDPNGTLLWTKTYPLKYRLGWTVADVVATTGYQTSYNSPTGWCIYVATTRKDSSVPDVVLLKYDQGGNLLWASPSGADPRSTVPLGIAVNDHARTPPERQRLYVVGKTTLGGTGGWGASFMLFSPITLPGFSSPGHYLGAYSGAGAQSDAVRVIGSNAYVVGTIAQVAGKDLMLQQFALNPAASQALTVAIDIKPETAENSINPQSRGKIPVAILSSRGFPAPDVIKPGTLTFGRLGTERSLAFCKPEDVNGDGLLDLACHFDTQKTAFEAGDTQGILKGLTVSGAALKGADAIRIVPARR